MTDNQRVNFYPIVFIVSVLIFAGKYLHMNIVEQLISNSGMTRDQVADKLKITRKTVYNHIKYPKRMNVDDIEKLAKLFGRSPRNIFSLIINN